MAGARVITVYFDDSSEESINRSLEAVYEAWADIQGNVSITLREDGVFELKAA
jgi:hypothetical protein